MLGSLDASINWKYSLIKLAPHTKMIKINTKEKKQKGTFTGAGR